MTRSPTMLLLLAAALLLGGCATHRELMPTPNRYLGATGPDLDVSVVE